jgi:hypothetical protein
MWTWCRVSYTCLREILFFHATTIWMTSDWKQFWHYLECIFWQTFSTWIGLVFHISCGSYAWGWTWGLEVFDDSSLANFECNQWESFRWAWSKVRLLEFHIGVSILNFNRFRLVPTFGRDTIRRFSTNTSQLRRMAARNYEDFLQVCALHSGLWHLA